jgi:hypothetical protein
MEGDVNLNEKNMKLQIYLFSFYFFQQDNNQEKKEKRAQNVGVLINGTQPQIRLLESIHSPSDELYSDLTELLGTSFVRIGQTGDELQLELLDPLEEELDMCIRCRKINNRKDGINATKEAGKLCQRCKDGEAAMGRIM